MQDIKQNITNILLYVFLFCIPALPSVSNILLVPIVILIVLLNVNKETYQVHITNMSWLPFFLFVLLLSFFNWSGEHKYVIRLLPLLLVPLFYLHVHHSSQIKLIFKILVLGVFFLQVKSGFHVLRYFSDVEFNFNLLKNHNQVNEILNYERPYLGYFSLLSLLIIIYKLKKDKIFWLLAFVNIVIILLISSKLAFIGLVITAILYIFKLDFSRPRFFAFLILIIALSILIVFNTNLYQRFFYLKYDLRWVIWDESLSILLDDYNILTGLGGQEKVDHTLKESYKARDFEISALRRQFVYGNYNSHNQFLNELLRGGLVGLALFLLPFIKYAKVLLKKENLFYCNLLLVLVLFLMVENLLQRQLGVFILAINFMIFKVVYEE